MARDLDTARRRILASGALLGAGVLAGCAGQGSSGDGANSSNAANGSGSGTRTASDEGKSYSVSMVPVGTVEFESMPETWVANNGSWADMGVALGLESPKALWLTSRYHTQYYDPIPGVSVDKSEMVSLYQDSVSKELFYELDGDVHVMDPNFLMNRFEGWEQADVEEIEANVAPFFGNSIYAHHYPWHDDYRYYSLYEAFEKLSRVFKRRERYQAFEELHATFRANLAPVIPGREKRPSVAVLWGIGDRPEKFYPYVIGGGTGFKHLRDLKVKDSLAETDIKDFHGSRAAIDLETLLEVDPEVLMLRGYESMTREGFLDTVVSFLRDHGTASALTAVENGDVYRAGGLYQGPITNLVLTERAAQQLYGVEKELYDRQRVAAIVNGEF